MRELKNPAREIVPGRLSFAGEVIGSHQLRMTEKLIQGLGADVDQAINGQKAVNAMANTPEGYYDLVFMDMQMPVMGGVEATRAIREQERTGGRKPVPIVAMTANAFNEDRERALAAGMDGFMTKPIDLAKLKRILEEYLAKP